MKNAVSLGISIGDLKMTPVRCLTCFLCFALFGTVFCVRPTTAYSQPSSEAQWDLTSDWVRFAASAAVAAYKGNTEGRKQMFKYSFAEDMMNDDIRHSIRNKVLDKRPKEQRISFPISRTSHACSGAGFLGARYGWEYSMPALAAAAGYARSGKSKENHSAGSIAAGCAISYGISTLFSMKEYSENFYPVASTDFIGFRLKWTN